MPHKIKVEDKEVSSAIEKGLKKLGLRRDQVEVTVLESPRKGFLGIGARPAVVELRQKRWVSDNLDSQIYMDVPKKKRSSGGRGRGGRSRSHKGEEGGVREIKRGGRRAYGTRHSAEKASKVNEPQLLPSEQIQNAVIPEFLKAPLQEAKDYLANVLEHMGVKVENLNAWWDEKQNRILLTFDCDHPAIVIGKEGKTLESLQYLATLSLSRHFDKPISVIADTQNYWRKAEDKINSDLEYGINQIKNGYSVYRFRPMSAQLRRYIHRAAENNEFVITVSEGEGQWRKVTLRPRPADQPVQKAQTEETAQISATAESSAPQAAEMQEMQAEAAAPAQETASVQTPAAEEAQTPLQTACADVAPQTDAALNAAPATQEAQPLTASEQPASAAQTVPVEQAPGCPAEAPAQETAPAVQNTVAEAAQAAAPAQEVAPAAQNPAETLSAVCPAQEPAAENQSGCACGPLFEQTQNTDEPKPQEK